MNVYEALRIAPGRQLRWSPLWPLEDASVLFDAASGDFWVLDHKARALLEQVARGGDSMTSQPAAATEDHIAAAQLVASLRGAGLLAPAPGVSESSVSALG